MDDSCSDSKPLDFFLCSLRTGMIYGPAKVNRIEELGFERIRWAGDWFGPPRLDEWEGYAVCVPARKEVWGVCKPTLVNGNIQADMHYQYQPMPEEDQKIFSAQPRPFRRN